MKTEDVVTLEASRRCYPVSRSLLSLCLISLFYAFLIATTIAVLVPLAPTMPTAGIDPSYAYAMNEAVAHQLSIGREIVFTYGPYASICTRNYDPATDTRMIWGTLFLALSFLSATLFLAAGKKHWLLLILFLFLATFGINELLLMSYPFLLVLCIVKETNTEGHGSGARLSWPKLIAVPVMLTTLGLLPIVKGSLLLPFATALVVGSTILALRARLWQALLFLITPLAASVIFWLAADQSLRDIPGFLRGTAWLTAGYTDAMSTSWSVIPAVVGDGMVVIYVAIAAIIVSSVAGSTLIKGVPKVLLLVLYCIFLLGAFKHSFIGSSYVSLSFASLAVFLLLMNLLSTERALVWAFVVAASITTATSIIRDRTLIAQVHEQFGMGAAWSGSQKGTEILRFCMQRALPAYARKTYESTWSTYRGAWLGVESRLGFGESLKDQFARANKAIRDENPLPLLDGTADIYNYDQSVLLASGNKWAPRPLLQGYTAYTPELARLDEEHLRVSNAPDWIVFNLQTINSRLPSLDDGVSWPAMLDNYNFVTKIGDYAFLRKKQVVLVKSSLVEVYERQCSAGKTIDLPDSDGPMFAEIDLRPTMAGKIATALFNPPQLWMVIGLQDGTTRRFRVVSEMMKTDFLLSPFVSDTNDFASFMQRHGSKQNTNKIRSISVAPAYGGSFYWSGTYRLTLRKYSGH